MHSVSPKTKQTGDYVAREVTGDKIDFSVGQPSPESLPLAALSQAAAHRLGSPDAELLLQYGPRQGYLSFRQSLAAFLTKRYGTAVDAAHLMVTAGVSHGLGLAVGALARPGDVVAVECPTYFLVPPIFRDHHLRLVPLRTDDHGLDVEALAAWLAADTSHRPRFVYTIPIHNNPRGTTLPAARRRRLLALAAQYDFLVLADEVYQLLSFPEKPSPTAAAVEQQQQAQGGGPAASNARQDAWARPEEGIAIGPQGASAHEPLPLPLRCYEDLRGEAGSGSDGGGDTSTSGTEGSGGSGGGGNSSRVLSFGSFSKMLAPALRLGWIECSNPALLSRLKEDGVISSGGCIAQMSAGLAHSALELGLQDAHLDGVVAPGLARRCAALCTALRRHLPECRLQQPRGGYFVWLEFPQEVSAKALLVRAEARHGVRFTPGPACGGGGEHCARLSFAFYTEQELEEGARRLGEALREHMAQEQPAMAP
ncbi:hypothetical protein HYH02_005153 [Chlamydomonas schloesseri]|uniref:Aminotransferase class I/classII large domain-containing protein n=1 Tax=Chlamydomonas schloesseri TaxID=2026947 RepID=A0A835WLF7_9CHLO|nr:hypothetical protein HYH02_005153 [Chlamydomonas schloesseri]|eukprot:KAG2449620.1 hypothetical protein HYH02_005153 [Chlamydomonas schloesseri]